MFIYRNTIKRSIKIIIWVAVFFSCSSEKGYEQQGHGSDLSVLNGPVDQDSFRAEMQKLVKEAREEASNAKESVAMVYNVATFCGLIAAGITLVLGFKTFRLLRQEEKLSTELKHVKKELKSNRELFGWEINALILEIVNKINIVISDKLNEEECRFISDNLEEIKLIISIHNPQPSTRKSALYQLNYQGSQLCLPHLKYLYDNAELGIDEATKELIMGVINSIEYRTKRLREINEEYSS